MKILFFLLTFILTLNANAVYIDADEVVGGGGGGGAVDSVFGRTGAVIALFGDYQANQITSLSNAGTGGGLTATNVQDALFQLDLDKIRRSGDAMTGSLLFNSGMGFLDNDLPSPNVMTFNVPNDLTGNTFFTLPDGDGLAGQFLQTNGSGILSWANAIQISDLDADTFINVESTPDSDNISFSTAGQSRAVIDNAGSVGIGTVAPDVSAVLDITAQKGVRLPRLTSLQRDALTPVESLLLYDTTIDSFVYYDLAQTSWRVLGRDSFDLDGDTSIKLDESANDNKIRFTSNALLKMTIAPTGVGIGTDTPDASALLDLSSITQGLLLPRLLTGQRNAIASPADGLMVYTSDIQKISFWDGSQWVNVPQGSTNSISDADADTKIQTEEGVDDDTLRFDTAGTQRMVIEADGDVGIGLIEPAVIDPTAAFQVTSTNKGAILPRLSTLARQSIATPADGLIIYDTDLDDLFVYDLDNAVWKPLYTLQDLDGDTGIVFDETLVDQDNIQFTILGTEKARITTDGSLAVGTSTPDASAIIDLTSTTKGALIPRMTLAERDLIATPAEGLAVFLTDLDEFSYFDGVAWQNLTSKEYIDNGDYGCGALTPYSTSVVGGNVILDQTTVFNFIDRSQGGLETNIPVTIPASTIIVPSGSVGANTTSYVSLKYDINAAVNCPADQLTALPVCRVQNLSPNTINLGKQILVTGPFTDGGGTITGVVQFQHYASNHAGTYTAYLDGGIRARFITGGSIGLSDADPSPFTATANIDFSVGQGTTYNSLMRDVEEESVFTAKNTNAVTCYKYRANSPDFTAITAGTGCIIPNEYWDIENDVIATAANNSFTVHTILGFVGSASNQFIGVHLGPTSYSSIDDAKNAIFSGAVLEDRSEGSNSAAVVGYVIVKGGIVNNFNDAVLGTDYEIVGSTDVISIAVSSGSASALGDLSDVTLATPLAGQILSYDSTAASWVAGPLNLTTTARDLLPAVANGSLIFNTTDSLLQYWDGVQWLTIPAGGGDVTAIHVNIANEISGIALKAFPDISDLLVIEDSAAGFAKKSITVGSIDHDQLFNFVANEHIDWTLPSAGVIDVTNYIEGGPNTDTTAFHNNVNGEIAGLPTATPTANDLFLFEDFDNFNAKRQATYGTIKNDIRPIVSNNFTPITNQVSSIDFVTGIEAGLTAGDDVTVNLNIFQNTARATALTGNDALTSRNGTLNSWFTLNDLITLQVEDTNPNTGQDYVLTWDADAASTKKVLLDTLLAGAGGGGGSAFQIIDQDGDTSVTVEAFEGDDADEIIMRVGNTALNTDRKVMTLNNGAINALMDGSFTINPRTNLDAQSVAIPLNVSRYYNSSNSRNTVAYLTHQAVAGTAMSANDEGSIKLASQRPGTGNIVNTAAEITWSMTSAPTDTASEGILNFYNETNISQSTAKSAELKLTNFTIRGFNGVSGKLQLNNAANSTSVRLTTDAAMAESYDLVLPDTAPTATGLTLEVESVNAGNVVTKWGSAATPIENVYSRANVDGNNMRSMRIGDTLMYWGRTVSINGGSNVQITFPVPFTTRPSVTVTSASRNGLLCATGTGGGTVPTTTTFFKVYAEGGGNNLCDFFVIGYVGP